MESSLKRDPLWQAQVAALLALLLQLLLPDSFLDGSKYILLTAEALLLLGLVITTPKIPLFRSVMRRLNAVTLISLAGLANIITLERLAHFLLIGGHITNGHQLLIASVNIYITNIIIFGMLYWEIDGGGPGMRPNQSIKDRDFMFPQMSSPESAAPTWRPAFIDYLYVSVTNATAFSPTDTMPMSHKAKLLMAIQATASLITIALIAARAVNILS